ncbi:hypothetical protein [Clostridium ganghwense]|uniref:Transposase n=1 Tax=Clostridium ganghwense TaxID=312089 RepID=A0ABT4CTP4_9CLOT|nr:hypothetical protein [Clostridium ganghwense]MCY6372445.1 hypothetical protein [Clostridium ganghwense]
MNIGQILKEKQPEAYRELNKIKKQSRRGSYKEHLSFNDYKQIMEEGRIYKRRRGVLRQVK